MYRASTLPLNSGYLDAEEKEQVRKWIEKCPVEKTAERFVSLSVAEVCPTLTRVRSILAANPNGRAAAARNADRYPISTARQARTDVKLLVMGNSVEKCLSSGAPGQWVTGRE